MPWLKIFINNLEARIAAQAAVALGEKIQQARFRPEATEDFEVFHWRLSPANHIYCFSPNATACIVPLLDAMTGKPYSMERCNEKPDLTGYTKLKI